MGPHRVNIINTLQLIAAPADQLEYQRRAPADVNVASEVVNQWFCDFYHPGESGFDAEFSTDELAVLAEFNRRYDALEPSLPSTLADLERSPQWAEVVAAAHEALNANGWLGVVATYDR